jgi:hypothetical protein
MTDYNALAALSVQTLVDRGMDFLVEEAKAFVQGHKLHELSKSQLSGLRSVIDKGENFFDLKTNVEEWMTKQEKKESGKKWKDIRAELVEKMFQWDKRADVIKKLAKKPFREQHPIAQPIERLLTAQNIAKDLEDLKFQLARKFFFTLLTVCRCYEDREIRKQLQEGVL